MPIPQIETERLLLRRFRPSDRNFLASLYSDPEIVRYLGSGQTVPASEISHQLDQLIEKYWEHGFGRWALVDKASGEVIGYCGLRLHENTPELVYVLERAYWCVGLATEAAKAVVQYAFQFLRLEKIMALTRPENIASARVLKKLGMEYCRGVHWYEQDCVLYSLAATAYQQSEVIIALRFAQSAGSQARLQSAA